MKRLSITIAFVFLISSLSYAHPHDENLAQTQDRLIQTADLFSKISEEVKPAVVYIQVTKNVQKDSAQKDPSSSEKGIFGDFFSNEPRKTEEDSFFNNDITFGSGSGFIINRQGYILTNNHVIAHAIDITVTLADKTSHKATIVGTDKATDVGLIKIDTEQLFLLPTVSLGDSDKLKTGEWVLAIGLPYEYIQTVTAGIVSATGRSSIGVSDYESFIQTDAAINQGNSGGPLINIHSEAIGINTAYLTQKGGYTGIGFAIPINIAKVVAKQLMTHGKVIRAWLGVGFRDANTDQLKLQGIPTKSQGALLVKVAEDSPAEKAGLQKDDIITAINQTAIASPADLRNRIALSIPHSKVTLEYYRDGLKHVIAVTLGTLE